LLVVGELVARTADQLGDIACSPWPDVPLAEAGFHRRNDPRAMPVRTALSPRKGRLLNVLLRRVEWLVEGNFDLRRRPQLLDTPRRAAPAVPMRLAGNMNVIGGIAS